MACASKSVSGDVISSSTVVPNGLEAPWILGILEVCAHDTTSEQSILEETLEGTLWGSPQA